MENIQGRISSLELSP